MVIYCDSESEKYIIQKRHKHLNYTRIIVMTLDDFYTNKYKEIFKEHHLYLDPERNKHNPELYMIWAEKSNFLQKTKNDNPFNSEFFLWCDIGCFRNRPEKKDIPLSEIHKFPNKEKIRCIPKDKIILTQTGKFAENCKLLNIDGLTKEEFTFYSHSIGGTIFGGHSNIIDKWHLKYYETLDKFINYKRFSGKDQNIMANIAVEKPELCLLFTPTYGDPWFYFHWLLS